jgi:hypothetical protein
MFFLTLLDSINFLQKYFENFGQILRFFLYTFCTLTTFVDNMKKSIFLKFFIHGKCFEK